MHGVPSRPTDVVSRRKLIATSATIAVGGGALATLATRPAAASVDFTVPDESYSGEDGSVSDIAISAEGVYEYTVPEAATIVLTLAVSPADVDDFQAVDQLERQPTGTGGSGQFGLSGSILAHDSLDAAQFSADAGEVTETPVAVRVSFEVRSDGETVATDQATDTATVTVENTSATAEVSISADGALAIEV